MVRGFVGIDWASEEHAVCVVDERGKVRTRFAVAHTSAGLRDLVARLRKLESEPSQVHVAIERPSGLLVDTLVEAGFTVVPIHPNVVKAARPRYSAAGGKDDRADAYLLADLLRTDGHRFRALKGSSDQTRALRALVRTRDDLVAMRVSLANQLRSLLESYWPGAAGIFAEVDSPIALAFVESYPTPAKASRLGERRLASFLARNRYSGRRSPDELLGRLREAAPGQAGPIENETKGVLAQALVKAIRPIVEQIAQITALIEHELEQHPDGPTIASFPRAGRINAAQILAELGDERERFTSAEHLAAEAGVAPVTRASGKHRSVGFRHACNKRLRVAITCFADNSRHASQWAAEVYQRARGRGCDHPHAVRILARAWIRILWRCWRDGTRYDPELHGGARRAA
ncbi:MAG: IS110 family transposase [Planctomycetes bacterium]|nr:IS110 family transposase [Planctomycetota bacterium]